jgi:DNA-3-methyladenine glycosylase I
MDAGIVRHRGKITAHAFLQAMRLVNDHIEGFATRKSVERARSVFQKPGRRPGQPV